MTPRPIPIGAYLGPFALLGFALEFAVVYAVGTLIF